MVEGKSFNCPSCGSSLSSHGGAAEIKCEYCGTTVIVPEELRALKVIVQTAARKSPPSNSLGVLMASLGLVIMFVVIGLFLILSRAPANDAPGVKSASPTSAGFARVVLTFGGEGTAPGLFQDARHIAVDQNGNMYIDDYKTMRVQKFDSTGQYASSWNVDDNLCSNKSATLNTLAADRVGNVYVHYCGKILKYDGAAGKLLAQFTGDQNPARDFYMDMVPYPDGGWLVLASGTSAGTNEVLLRLNAEGKLLARYPNPVTTQSPKRPANAMTLEPALDGLGNIFLLNTDENAIYKFTPDGRFVTKFGSVGTGAGQFDSWAQNIAVDNQSRVYVTDFKNLKVYDSNGTFLDSMSDHFVGGGITEMRINDKNQVYIVGSKSAIFKLTLNKP